MAEFPRKLFNKLQDRRTKDGLRELAPSSHKVDFVSNDYLGMAKDEGIFKGAYQFLLDQNAVQNGSTGSRLLSGNNELFLKTEEKVAHFYGSETALIFNSGYDANLSFFAAVPQRTDVVFYDEFSHASIRDGIALGKARSYKFEHNNIEDLRALVNRVQSGNYEDMECYVVTEAVFSMDGDSPDMDAMIALCKEYNCHLIVDEAHAIKTTNESIKFVEQKEDDPYFARLVTFGKAIGVQGAAILGSSHLKSYLVNFARSFIYTTALPPISIASVLIVHSEEYLDRMKTKTALLQRNIQYFKDLTKSIGLSNYFIPSSSPIHCCIIPGNKMVKEIAVNLQKNGFDIRPILAPTVPEGQERLRFCLHSFNTQEEIKEVLSILSKSLNAQCNGE
ncbi:MAG: pyridoxal phosphate-dependent aminotransferase family protein [Eudoraea sp.]|nr:pyridoxal phosphate-dependent aminotransferase family protein [Eudoraea sp.]